MGIATVTAVLCFTAILTVIMQNALTIQGHVPAGASRALRALNVRKMCVSALALVRRQSLTIASISAASCYAGVILGCDALAFTAAFASLGFAWLADKYRKGGEK